MPLLSETNPHPKDQLIRFEEDGHKYFYNPTGERIRKSMTSLLKPHFDTFDGPAIAARGQTKWMNDETSKYWGLCNYLKMVQDATDEQVVEAICKLWEAKGNQAAAAGTAVHYELELYIQGLLPPPDLNALPPMSVAAYLGFLESFYPDQQLEPWRVEFPCVLVVDEVVVVCGTIDFLMRSKKDGRIWMFDWKTTNPKKKGLLGKRKVNMFKNEKAGAPFDQWEADDYHKYSAQLLGYKWILEQGGYDLKIAGCFIVQIHADLERAHVVEVDEDMAEAVDAVMRAEVAHATNEALDRMGP